MLHVCCESIPTPHYSQGRHGEVDTGNGECLIVLQRKVACSVALNLNESLFVEDSVYLPVTLNFAIKDNSA